MNSLSPYEPGPGDIGTNRASGYTSNGSFTPPSSNLKDFDSSGLRRVLRRWPIAALLGIGFALLTFVACHFITKIYESTAEVMMQTPGQPQQFSSQAGSLAALAGLSGLSAGEDDIPTQIEVMTSDSALREVADQTGIDPDPAKSRKMITIVPHKTSTVIVLVSVKDPSPTRAQAAVQALVDVYNEHMGHQNSSLTGRMIVATQAQLASVGAKLATSESELASYSRAVGSVDPDTEAAQKVMQLYTLRKERLDVLGDLGGANSELAAYQAQVGTLSPSVVPTLTLTPSPLVQSDQTKLSDLLEERSSLAAQYTPQDDEMVQNQEQIDAVRNDIREEIERQARSVNSTVGTLDTQSKSQSSSATSPGYEVYNVTRALNPVRESARQKAADLQAQVLSDSVQLNVLNKALSGADSDLAATPDKLRRLGDLKNDSEVYQKLYDDLQGQLVQLNARKPVDERYATMLQMPSLPKKPIMPAPFLWSAAAGAFGSLLGIILMFMVDSYDTKLRDPSDFAQISDLPVLQRLPYSNGAFHGKRAAIAQQSYQRLAATLSYQGVGSTIRSLMLTSAAGTEGSSMVAARLAAALSAAGRNVILVDTTGPEPKVVPLGSALIVDTTFSNGSSNGESKSADLAISSGAAQPLNMTSMLHASETQALIDHLKGYADLVIFDAPAVFEGISSAVLAQKVDAVLYVSKLDGLTREEIRQAVSLILTAPAPVLGVVLNDERL